MYWFVEILIISLGFACFALLHTLLARQQVKRKLFANWPSLKSYYRFLYTIFATVTLGVWYLYSPFPDGTLYRIPLPYSIFFRVLQAGGVLGFLLSLRALNLVEFVGVQQLVSPNRKEVDAAEDELITDGLYRWVRHPLYTTTIMMLLFNPVMTAKLGIITILVILYSWIGSIFEERNLTKMYGEEYEEYRQEVSRFIPKIPLF